jgi:hypothetical protein
MTVGLVYRIAEVDGKSGTVTLEWHLDVGAPRVELTTVRRLRVPAGVVLTTSMGYGPWGRVRRMTLPAGVVPEAACLGDVIVVEVPEGETY